MGIHLIYTKKPIRVAGSFAGVHNNALIIAGGANLPDIAPWEIGKRTFSDDIFVLQNYVRPGHKDKGLADGLKDKSPDILKAEFYLGHYNGKELETLKSPFTGEKTGKP